MEKKKVAVIGIIVVLLIIILIGSYFIFRSPWKFQEDRAIKIFWLNSYHSDFVWAKENIDAFKDVFEKGGIEIEIKNFDMDTIRKPSEEDKQSSGRKAIELIDEYKPDLIYATDDNAQEFVVKYIDTDIPIVFSGLNLEPEKYGYDKAKNVAGVLERLHFADTVNFLKEFYPDIKKIAVISDSSSQWEPVINRMKERQNEIPEIEFVGWHQISEFEEFKQMVLYYQDKVDAFIFLSLETLSDAEGNVVPDSVTTKWLVENNNLPEGTFWPIVDKGMLLSVVVSPEEQGRAAGKIAHKILIEGKKPSSFEFEPTEKGDQYINLARAEKLGIKKEDMPSIILINSKVFEEFPWEDN
jgi:ABC-type uncharacterized transport system substrate-binding protein